MIVSFWSARARSIDVERDRAGWGAIVEVWCAEHPLAPGDVVADVVYRCELPAARVPPSAISSTVGIVAQHVDADSVVTDVDVAESDRMIALAPTGWVAVTVIEAVPSGAGIAERVMLVAEGIVLAEEAVVIDTGSASLVVAVPRSLAATVAAASDGDLNVVRLAP